MSERWTARIVIGGLIPETESLRLAQLVADEGLAVNEEFRPLSVAQAVALIEDMIDWEKPMELVSTKAVVGTFPRLEPELRRMGLAYRRCDDGSDGRAPKVVFWEPFLPTPRIWRGCHGAVEPMLSAGEINDLQLRFRLQPEVGMMNKAREFPFPLRRPEDPALKGVIFLKRPALVEAAREGEALGQCDDT